MHYVWLRRTVQLLLLLLFFVLLFRATGPTAETQPPADLFLRADPLAALTALLSGAPVMLSRMWPALVVLVATVLLGRVFCGWVCPLGTTIDIFDTLIWRRYRKRREQPRWPRLKYYLLAAFLVAAIFSTQVAYLMDPIPLLTRVSTLTVYPVYTQARTLWATEGRPVWRPLVKSKVIRRPRLPVPPRPAFRLGLLTLLIFAGILATSAISRRFWCRSLCPLGALLALVGRLGLLKRKADDRCTQCRRCVHPCKMGAIPADEPDSTLLPECIQCFNCVPACPEGSSTVGFHLLPEGSVPSPDLQRRRLLQGAAAGLGYGLVMRTGAARADRHDRLIRPPGAPRDLVSEDEFLGMCVRCGECMKVCISGGIQPAVLEAGLEGIWTPVLVPRIGACEHKCVACGNVCPTGALKPFTVEEKDHIQIGLATIHHERCLAWRKEEHYDLCLVCDEQCPYKAVTNRVYQGEKRPFVDEAKCTGCGMCEKACPIKPEAAIIVYRAEKGRR